MYTKHGHQILGTPVEGFEPQLVVECGWPSFCAQCVIDASFWLAPTMSELNTQVINQQNRKVIMEFSQFVRRPFAVEAVQINVDNLHDVADLIGKVQTESGVTFIALDRRIIPNINRAYVGWWLTRLGNEYRCYANKVFKKQFIEHEEVIAFSFADDPEDEVEEEKDPTPAHGIERPANLPSEGE